MKYYIDYYQRGIVTGDLIPACGDRSLIRLDGRLNLDNMHQVAREENGHHRPKYAAYQLIKGDHLLSASPISGVIEL